MLINLEMAIRARGLRQFAMAQTLGVHPARISEIIAGRRTASPELRSRLAELLRADADWLFCQVVIIPQTGSSGANREAIRAHNFAGSGV